MESISLLKSGNYTSDWVKDFYNQAGIWWGADTHDDPNEYQRRVAVIERLCGKGAKRIMDLGAGSGFTASALAEAGHTVVGVELNKTDIDYAQALLLKPFKGSMQMIEGDFYTVQLDGRFDVVCWWEGFGVGTDSDQRLMLRRIADEWLAPDGCALIDVYNPTRPIRYAEMSCDLDALENVPGSVAMIETCHFDPVYSRWIDEWKPTANPEKALAQSLRCYTPADFLLLLEPIGLELKRIEFEGEEVDFRNNRITISEPMLEAWGYLAVLKAT